jgi:hypothetical protein
MSSAGHVFDMIARMKNNRMKHDERRNRQKKVMDSLSDKANVYDHVNNDFAAEPMNEAAISQIHQNSARQKRKYMMTQIIILTIALFLVTWFMVRLLT